jgi:hypothetical protein
MSDALKPGDRVRVTEGSQVKGYLPGDKGTVTAALMGRRWYYLVQMDKVPPTGDGIVFTEDEIEPDV